MAAYAIYARHAITDEAKSRQYSKLAVPQIRDFGGEVVTARSTAETLEGEWEPTLVTILKFDSRQALMNWYNSPEYAPLKQMRLESNVGDFIMIEDD